MAQIMFQVMQKPSEERIIDAACIYWEVERAYFYQKKTDRLVTYRKAIIYYLIKSNSDFSYKNIAELFGFLSHQAVLRLVENMDSTKNVFKRHFNDINQIQNLADKLNAAFIQTDIKLLQADEAEQFQVRPVAIQQRKNSGFAHAKFSARRTSKAHPNQSNFF